MYNTEPSSESLEHSKPSSTQLQRNQNQASAQNSALNFCPHTEKKDFPGFIQTRARPQSRNTMAWFWSGQGRSELQRPIKNFLRVCESNKGQMYRTVDGMKAIVDEMKQEKASENKLESSRKSAQGQMKMEASKWGFFLSPFGSGFISESVKQEYKCEPALQTKQEKRERLMEIFAEFLNLIKPMNRALKELKELYVKIRRDPENLIRLQIRIDDLPSSSTASFSLRPLEITQRSEKCLTELEDLLQTEDLIGLICKI
ncbi:hypothetical protein WMY93_032170 [Mugilogobius chulae]|uniref:Uncharacterized protein n=1 Tax=Mugilogobius chulae TaxID=88201 RepID=A0AAW0MCL7_9GOBI